MNKNFKLFMFLIILLTFSFVFLDLKVFAAEVISGFNATVTTKTGNSSNTNFSSEQGYKKITISNSKTYAYYEYKITGLDSNKLYIVSADLKTENIDGNGAIVGTEKNEVSYNYGVSKGLSGTNDWTKKSVVVQPKKDGTTTVFFGMGYRYNNYGISTGSVYIDNITIEDATSSDQLKIGESSNKGIKMVVWKEDYDKANLSSSQFQTFLDRLETMYNHMVDLVGNSSYGVLYPSNNEQVVFMITNVHQYGALAGYPIEINANYVLDHLNAAKKSNYISWTLLHETGHLFDKALSNKDNTYKTSNDRYSRQGEQTASFYPLYVMEKMNLVTDGDLDYSGQVNKYKNAYINEMQNGKFYGDGFNYLLTEIKKDGKTDWDAFKSTYKWFNDLDQTLFDEQIDKNNYHKIMWYLKKLDDYSEANVREIFSDNDIKAIANEYAPFTKIDIIINSENNSDEVDDIEELTDNYQLNIVTESTNSNDILVYESSNENVATIDDFGKVTLKPTSKDRVTLTVRSFLEPEVKASYTFKVTPTLSEEEDENADFLDDTNTKNEEEKVENPQTGVYYSFGILLFILCVGISMIAISKKHNKFPKV